MQSIHLTSFEIYLMLVLFMIFPSFSVYAQTPDGSGKVIPPIDQNPPGILETASFGLG